MSDLLLGTRVLIALHLVYPPSEDAAVRAQRRRRQDATALPLAIAFGAVGVLGLLLAVTGAIVGAWTVVAPGAVIAVAGGLGCRKFVRFRRRRRRGELP